MKNLYYVIVLTVISISCHTETIKPSEEIAPLTINAKTAKYLDEGGYSVSLNSDDNIVITGVSSETDLIDTINQIYDKLGMPHLHLKAKEDMSGARRQVQCYYSEYYDPDSEDHELNIHTTVTCNNILCSGSVSDGLVDADCFSDECFTLETSCHQI